jgi:hypothetical protein
MVLWLFLIGVIKFKDWIAQTRGIVIASEAWQSILKALPKKESGNNPTYKKLILSEGLFFDEKISIFKLSSELSE